MRSIPKIAVLILAAGESKRMGMPKQLLSWGSTTLLGHAINEAKDISSGNLFVVLGANFEQIEKEITTSSVTILNNKHWKMGLGSSIASGLQYILKLEKTFDGVLLLLADQPLIKASYLRKILQEFQISENQIIASSYEKGVGVPALFDASYFNLLSGLDKNNGAKYIIEQYNAYVTKIEALDMLTDIDTPENYENLFRKHFL